MFRSRTCEFWFLLFLFVIGATLVTSPVVLADERDNDVVADTGEPTDPECTLQVFEDHEIDVRDHGLSITAPADEADSDSWFESLLQLLRSL